MPRYDFDLFTIGAGSGGVAGTRRAGAVPANQAGQHAGEPAVPVAAHHERPGPAPASAACRTAQRSAAPHSVGGGRSCLAVTFAPSEGVGEDRA